MARVDGAGIEEEGSRSMRAMTGGSLRRRRRATATTSTAQRRGRAAWWAGSLRAGCRRRSSSGRRRCARVSPSAFAQRARGALLRRRAGRSCARRVSFGALRSLHNARASQSRAAMRHLVEAERRGREGDASACLRGRGVPPMMPACGPPRSLSPEKKTRSAPAARLSWTVGSLPRPNWVVSSRQPLPRSSSSRRPRSWARDARSLRDGDSVKPMMRKLLVWTRRRAAVSAVIAACVVGEVGAVGRSHLDEAGAALGHDVGDAEAAADLDQLAAGDDDLAVGGQGGEHQARRRRRCC